MPATSVAIEISAEPEAIFDLIHDYSRRLDWDPFPPRSNPLEWGNMR